MTFFIINKSNLLNNIKVIKSKLNKDVKLCAMVKADAYSHDLNVISKILKSEVDYFGVAKVKEALKIRKNDKNTPIICVGDFDDNEVLLAYKNNIELTIHNIESFKKIEKMKLKVNVHVKIDTGMSRLGFKSLKEIDIILNKIKNCKYTNLVGIFSHFVDSENNRILTDKQFEKFSNITNICNGNIIKHICNTGGLEQKKYHLNMVRIGLGLYGYGNIKGLKPVMSLVSKVISIRFLDKNETVGYNALFRAEKACKIATISLGYADGLDLRLIGSKVKINGQKYKIVGKICMDMFMCLVDDNVKIGDNVIIFDNVKYLASYTNKSIYEFLSNIRHDRCTIKIIN